MKQLSSYMEKIVRGHTNLSDADVDQYRLEMSKRGFFIPPKDTNSPAVAVRSRNKRKRKYTRGPGTELKKSLAWIEKIKPDTATCSCDSLSSEMDKNGVKWCRTNSDSYLIPKMLENKDAIITAMKAEGGVKSLMAIGAGLVPEKAIRGWLSAKIESACVKHETVKPRRRKSTKRKPYTGWRSEADGPRIEHGPFVSTVRHLTYHIYPQSEQSWQWNLTQLSQRFDLFNGTKLLGIATDAKTVGPQVVREFASSLGMEFDHVIEVKNVAKLREVTTWVPMLERLNPETATDNEVVFSAHAKGQKYDDAAYTRDWTYLMYKSCLDHWPAVEVVLSDSLMAGSFREFGLLGKWNDWAYSGTFFWWRLAELGNRDWRSVDKWFAGTESWPGKMCDPRETSCLFMNDNARLYVPEYWTSTVWPAWKEYNNALRGI